MQDVIAQFDESEFWKKVVESPIEVVADPALKDMVGFEGDDDAALRVEEQSRVWVTT